MIQDLLENMCWRERFDYLQKQAGWVPIPCRMKWDPLKKDKIVGFPKKWTTLETWSAIQPHVKYSNNACMIRTGPQVGIVGVDVDDIGQLDLLWRYLHPNRQIPEDQNYFDTFTCESGGKNCGLHFIFQYTEELPRNKQDLKWILDGYQEDLGIDIRSTGGSLFFTPSVGKRKYSVLPFSRFDNIRTIPEGLLRFLKQDIDIPNIITDEFGISEVNFIPKRPRIPECSQKTHLFPKIALFNFFFLKFKFPKEKVYFTLFLGTLGTNREQTRKISNSSL